MAQGTFRASVELHSTVDTVESWPTHRPTSKANGTLRDSP